MIVEIAELPMIIIQVVRMHIIPTTLLTIMCNKAAVGHMVITVAFLINTVAAVASHHRVAWASHHRVAVERAQRHGGLSIIKYINNQRLLE
jgi:hypothetical protein